MKINTNLMMVIGSTLRSLSASRVMVKPTIFINEDQYKANWAVLKHYMDCMFQNEELHYDLIIMNNNSYSDLFLTVYECVNRNKKGFSKFNMKIEAGEQFPNSKFVAQRSLGYKSSAHVRDKNFFKTFHKTLVQFFLTMHKILDVFPHLNSMAVYKLKTDLKTEMEKLFCSEVCDSHIEKLLIIVRTNHPDISSEMKSLVLNQLYQVNPEYALQDSYLFAKVMTDQEYLQDLLVKKPELKAIIFGPFL